MSSVKVADAPAIQVNGREGAILEAAVRLFARHGYRKVTMVDIAAAAAMSRPTLYAAFASKEAIFAALLERDRARHEADSARQLAGATGLRERLERLFEIWLIRPFAMVVDSENGTDLLANCSVYAPRAAAELYGSFESRLAEVLRPTMVADGRLTGEDLAHLLMLATRGLKANTATLAEFERLLTGLITMTIATVERGAIPPEAEA